MLYAEMTNVATQLHDMQLRPKKSCLFPVTLP